MISYFGDYPTSAVVYIPFNTFDSNDPTASVTVTNLVNTDVHIHKDGGTTQRNNAAGITMTVDYDSITGNHLLAIDTSDNTVADFFQAGHEYQVRIEGATVDGGTVNAWVGAFSIERSGGALALIKNGTYGLSALNALLAHADYGLAKLVRSTTPANTLSVDAAHLVAVPATQKVDVDTIKTQAITCAAGVTVLASVGTAATSTAQTGDSYAIVNGDHGLVSIQDDIDAIKTKTDLLPTWPANLEHLSITDTTGLVDITQTAADKAWGTAARVLTANTNLSIPSAADVADAVWDEASTGHTDAGKAGTQLWTVLNDIPSTSEFEARTLAAADYTIVTDLGTVQTGDSFAIINGDHGLVSIQDDIDALYASIITNATGADIAADIIALKVVADKCEDILGNKMEITDATGAVTLYADNSSTPLLTGTVVDDLTTTTRGKLA